MLVLVDEFLVNSYKIATITRFGPLAMSQNTLCPGYTQVSSFGPNDDYERGEDGEIEEEVSYVTLDLGSVEPTLVPSSSNYRLIVSCF